MLFFDEMFAAPLGTGSAGNCHFVESGQTRILVDAGFGPRQVDKRLRSIGRSLESIDAIVLTHEHHDHIRGADKISRKYGIPVYGTRGTLDRSRFDETAVRVRPFVNNRPFRIGDLEIHPRRVTHDAADPACFVIESTGGARLGIATDLGWVDRPVRDHLSGCDTLFFEANHDLDMLRDGTYPWVLKRRIMSNVGHLSNDESFRTLLEIADERLHSIVLIHLSQKNNHETIVRGMANDLLETTGAPIEIRISKQEQAETLIDVARCHNSAKGQLRLFG